MKRLIFSVLLIIALANLVQAQQRGRISHIRFSAGIMELFQDYNSYGYFGGERMALNSYRANNSPFVKLDLEKNINSKWAIAASFQIDFKSNISGFMDLYSAANNDRLGSIFVTTLDGNPFYLNDVSPGFPACFNPPNTGSFIFNTSGLPLCPRGRLDLESAGYSSPQYVNLLMSLSDDPRSTDDYSSIQINEDGYSHAVNFKIGPTYTLENKRWVLAFSPQVGITYLRSNIQLNGAYNYRVRPLFDTPVLDTTTSLIGIPLLRTHNDVQLNHRIEEEKTGNNFVGVIGWDQRLGFKLGKIVVGYNLSFQTSTRYTISHEVFLYSFFDVQANEFNDRGINLQLNRQARWVNIRQAFFVQFDL
ncbi:MAG: hypothetical protein AAFY71_08160 [Bacteroidota bacterium]